MATIARTGLSLTPTTAQGSVDGVTIDVADTDVLPWSFDAGEAISGVTATVETIPAHQDATADIVDAADVSGGTAGLVRVSGFTRGVSYLLAVTLTKADGTTATYTLGIRCVA